MIFSFPISLVFIVLLAESANGISNGNWINVPIENSAYRMAAAGGLVKGGFLIFGGSDGKQSTNTLLTCSMESLKCEETSTPLVARGETGYSITAEGRLYVHGGRNGNLFYDDLWKYDSLLAKWSMIETAGVRPLPRSGHCAEWSSPRNQLYIFGGFKSPRNYYSDFWSFDLSTSIWTQLVLTDGHAPSERYFHACALKQVADGNQKLYIHGGLNASRISISDLWEYNFKSLSWTNLNSKYAMAAHSLHYSPTSDTLIAMLGKISGTFNSTFISTFDLSTNNSRWTAIRRINSGPKWRQLFLKGFDPKSETIYIYGGINDHLSNDLWKYETLSGAVVPTPAPKRETLPQGASSFPALATGLALTVVGLFLALTVIPWLWKRYGKMNENGLFKRATASTDALFSLETLKAGERNEIVLVAPDNRA